MLAPVSRFRYTKTYAYGSIAFVAGFAAVMGLLIHFTPLRVIDANIATISTPKVAEKQAGASASTQKDESASNDTTPVNGAASPVATMPTVTVPSATTPSTGSNPTTPSTPADPTVPTTPTDPTIPVDPTNPTVPEVPVDPPVDPTIPILPIILDPLLDVTVSL